MLLIGLRFGVAIWGSLARFFADKTLSVVANPLSWSMALRHFLVMGSGGTFSQA